MSNTIKLKRGTSTPSTSDISNGEVAIDTSAKKLYINDSGTVKEIGGSGTIAGASGLDFNDNVKVRFGTGNDLEIYHDGSNSLLTNATGYTLIRSDNLALTSSTGPENFLVANVNDGVDLYYDDSKKVETTANGLKFPGGSTDIEITSNQVKFNRDSASSYIDQYGTGDISFRTTPSGSQVERLKITSGGNVLIPSDSTELQIGASGDLILHHNGSNSIIKDVGTGGLHLVSNAFKVMNVSQNEAQIYANENAEVELYYDNTKKFETTSAGATLSGHLQLDGHLDMNDDHYIKLGTGDDLEIYHNGTYSYIKDSSTALIVNTVTFAVKNNADNEDILKGVQDGAVELYYDNVKKLNTHADGVEILGKLYMADNKNIELGNSQDFKIYHAGGTANKIESGANTLYLAADDLQITNAAISEACLKTFANGAVELYYDNSKKLETTSAGVEVTGNLVFDASVSGGTIKLGDDQKVFLGGGDDLKIYHDGSNSIITAGGAGDLQLISTFDDVDIKAADNIFLRPKAGEDGLKVYGDGGVELYYDGGKKLETLSGGGTLTGDWTVTNDLFLNDSGEAVFGTGGDLKIYHDGTDSYIVNATNQLIYHSGTDHKFRVNDGNENSIWAKANGAVELYYDNSKKFETNSAGVKVTGQIEADEVYLRDDEKILLGTGSDLKIYHDGTVSKIDSQTSNLEIRHGGEKMIACAIDAQVELYYDGSKKFETVNTGAKVTGDLFFNDSHAIKLGTGQDLWLYHDGTNSYINDVGTGDLVLQASTARIINAAATENIARFFENGSCELYYNNAKKFETTSNGVKLTSPRLVIDGSVSSNVAQLSMTRTDRSWNINNETDLRFYTQGTDTETPDTKIVQFGTTGIQLPDSIKYQAGTGDDLQIFHDSWSSIIRNTNDSTPLYLQPKTGEHAIKMSANGATELYYDNSKKLETTSTGVEVTGIVDADAFIATADTGYKYSTLTSPGNTNIPYNAWTTISTNYGWSLPSAGTYLLTSSMRIRMWDVTGYIQCRLYDNTNSSAISDSIRMMWEQQSDTLKINVQITLQWVHTCTGAVTIYQQFNTTENSSATSIQNDNNGRNNVYWQRIG